MLGDSVKTMTVPISNWSWVENVFDKGYMLNWFCKQFTVSSMVPNTDKIACNSRSVYILKDDSGKDIRSKSYQKII